MLLHNSGWSDCKTKLRHVTSVIVTVCRSPAVRPLQNVSLLVGGSSSSSNSLTERLLRQNAELTGFVSRLTEEKNDLRNHTLRLEEELRRYRQAGLGSGDSVSTVYDITT